MNEIEVWADVWCPFAHVGLRRVIDERDRRHSDVRLRVRAWPLELVNGRPLDPAFIAEEVDEIRPQLPVPMFTGFRQDRFPTSSLPALALTEAAYDVDVVTGELVALGLRDALFEQGLDVGDRDVLDQIARQHGVGPVTDAHRAAVEQAWHDGQARGVVGSPHVFNGSGNWFCPALQIRRVDGHLDVSFSTDAFEQFLEACLG
jgi:predicted DsbA family dithiol-disulfide isomerase